MRYGSDSYFPVLVLFRARVAAHTVSKIVAALFVVATRVAPPVASLIDQAQISIAVPLPRPREGCVCTVAETNGETL